MKVSRRVLARHIATQLVNGADRSQLMESLAAYIVTHRLKGDIQLILADVYRNLAGLGYVQAHVTTARAFDSVLEGDIRRFIEKLEGTTQIEMVTHVDPAMLGGVVIETPTKRFDASVATRLKRLRNA